MSTFKQDKLDKCIHCGLCLEQCPTYLVTRDENESPRGRIYQMKAVHRGEIEIRDPSFIEHQSSCIVCRSCETACPSGVEFSVLMEESRLAIRNENPSLVRHFIYWKLLNSKWMLACTQFILALLSRTSLPHLFGSYLVTTRFKRFAASLKLLPKNVPFRVKREKSYPAQTTKKGTVALLIGCVGDVMTSRINDATISVLTKLGYDVIPIGGCCGALSMHAGYYFYAMVSAAATTLFVTRKNVDAFITNITGCGAMIKDYPHKLRHNDMQTLSSKTFDIAEFLMKFESDTLRSLLHQKNERIAYHAPCHLIHGQKIQQEPLDLLRLVSDNVAELEENTICCGSGGSYNIEHPDMADELLRRKVHHIDTSDPDIVITANAGCLLQIQSGVPNRHVQHIIEYIDASITA